VHISRTVRVSPVYENRALGVRWRRVVVTLLYTTGTTTDDVESQAPASHHHAETHTVAGRPQLWPVIAFPVPDIVVLLKIREEIKQQPETMSDDGEDLIASLGTSLMQEILADLQVDDSDAGWLNLEQLEKELSHLDSSSGGPEGQHHAQLQQQQGEPYASAASMVVHHARQQQQQQQQQQSVPPPPSMQHPQPVPVEDAWSLSLQKFTATSFEEDFLQADTARKQQQQHGSQTTMPPGLDFSKAEEYDETAPMAPPPGIAATGEGGEKEGAAQQELLSQAADVLMQQLQRQVNQQQRQSPSMPPRPTQMPLTPQNSISIQSQGTGVPATPPPSAAQTPAPAKMVVPEQRAMPSAPPPPAMTAIPVGVPVGVPAPYHHPMPPQPHHLQQPMPPPGAPMVPGGPAWQRPPPMLPQPHPASVPPPPSQPQLRLFCNPHPRAHPIPASQLESRYMKPRDISYVVHSILKPLLLAGASSVDSYDIQFHMRLSGPQPGSAGTGGGGRGGRGGKSKKDGGGIVDEMQSRSVKSKEWSSEHHALGHVAKTNVARPRALIAQPVEIAATNLEQKQRASLWKARIYCDQAYQAFFQVMGGWKSGGASSRNAATVQAQYAKLFKCLGINKRNADPACDDTQQGPDAEPQQQKFEVEKASLGLLLKLEKGRILLSRILEQALLPPNSVQPLLPATLSILLASSSSSSSSMSTQATNRNDPSDDRLFVAMARVIQTLPSLSGEIVLECVRMIIDACKSKEAAASPLSSTSRMQCVHALLHRGGAMAAADDSGDSFKQKWSQAEAEFMKILTGM